MRKVFVINGLPNCGKTTFGNLVDERLSGMGINFLHTSSIDPIKNLLKKEDEWFPEFLQEEVAGDLRSMKSRVVDRDWDGETKDEYWRRAMSDLKLLLKRYDPDFVHRWVMSNVMRLAEPSVAFVDNREPENIDAFKGHCLEKHGLMVRSVLVESDMGEAFHNRSDGEDILGYNYDIRVRNDRMAFNGDIDRGMAALRLEVNSFIEVHVVNSKSKEIVM